MVKPKRKRRYLLSCNLFFFRERVAPLREASGLHRPEFAEVSDENVRGGTSRFRTRVDAVFRVEPRIRSGECDFQFEEQHSDFVGGRLHRHRVWRVEPVRRPVEQRDHEQFSMSAATPRSGLLPPVGDQMFLVECPEHTCAVSIAQRIAKNVLCSVANGLRSYAECRFETLSGGCPRRVRRLSDPGHPRC